MTVSWMVEVGFGNSADSGNSAGFGSFAAEKMIAVVEPVVSSASTFPSALKCHRHRWEVQTDRILKIVPVAAFAAEVAGIVAAAAEAVEIVAAAVAGTAAAVAMAVVGTVGWRDQDWTGIAFVVAFERSMAGADEN